jgi:O-antigen/teichoic acid export membrane protein
MNNVSPILENNNEGTLTRAVRGGSWFFFDIFTQKVINFINFFILARILLPEDYGVMAVALITAGITNQIIAFPFGNALIQKKDDIESYLDPLWSLELIRSGILAALLVVCGGFIAAFFHLESSVVWIVRLSGLIILFPALSNIRTIHLFKRLQFRTIFIRDVVSLLAFPACAISYALLVERSAWALFVGYLGQHFMGIIMSYVIIPTRPSFTLTFSKLRSLVGYTKWVFGQNFLDLILQQFDRILVGRLLNTTELGLYGKAKDLAFTVTGSLTDLVAKVGFPAFSRVQHDIQKIRIGILKSIDMLLLINVLPALLIVIEGLSIVSLLLGDRWLSVVVPLQIFALGSIFNGFFSVLTPVFGALGRPDINFKTNALHTMMTVPAVLIGIRLGGVIGLAIAIVITWLIMLAYLVWRMRSLHIMGVRAFFIPGVCVAAAALVMVALDLSLRSWIHAWGSAAVTICWFALLVGVYYLVLFILSWRLGHGPIFTLRDVLRELGVVKRAS